MGEELEEQELMRRLKEILPPDRETGQRVKKRLDGMAKPLGSLGKLETLLIRAGAIYRTEQIDFSRRCVVVFCGDNGVVEEGISQSGQEVTAIVAQKIAQGCSTVNRIARQMHCDVLPVDIGMAQTVCHPNLQQSCVRRGTANFAHQPAMSRREAVQAIGVGIETAGRLKEAGYRLLATGEMGIGNTTTSSAVASVLLQKDPAQVTGRGAGLTGEGLRRKIEVIGRGIALHHPDPSDPLDVLSKVGGLDIAGMAGLMLGGACYGIPVIADGVISNVAALVALRLCPKAADYLFGSHISSEPAGRMIVEELGLLYFLDCGMHLGEGTGAVTSLALYDLAQNLYETMSTFEDYQMQAYQPLI